MLSHFGEGLDLVQSPDNGAYFVCYFWDFQKAEKIPPETQVVRYLNLELSQ